MNWITWIFRRRAATPREYRIFVSYSRRDRGIVEPLVQILRLSGTGVFRDVDHIPPGTQWRAVLIDALDSCELCLLFWCHHSAASAEVRKEYMYALQGGKRVTPVLLDGTPLGAILSEYQAIDMRGLFSHEDATPDHGDLCLSIDPLSPDEERMMQEEATRRLLAGIGAELGALELQRPAESRLRPPGQGNM